MCVTCYLANVSGHRTHTSSHMIKVSHFDTFVMQQKGYVTCASDGRTLLKYCIDAAGRRTRMIQEKSTSKQITTSVLK